MEVCAFSLLLVTAAVVVMVVVVDCVWCIGAWFQN